LGIPNKEVVVEDTDGTGVVVILDTNDGDKVVGEKKAEICCCETTRNKQSSRRAMQVLNPSRGKCSSVVILVIVLVGCPKSHRNAASLLATVDIASQSSYFSRSDG